MRKARARPDKKAGIPIVLMANRRCVRPRFTYQHNENPKNVMMTISGIETNILTTHLSSDTKPPRVAFALALSRRASVPRSSGLQQDQDSQSVQVNIFDDYVHLFLALQPTRGRYYNFVHRKSPPVPCRPSDMLLCNPSNKENSIPIPNQFRI